MPNAVVVQIYIGKLSDSTIKNCKYNQFVFRIISNVCAKLDLVFAECHKLHHVMLFCVVMSLTSRSKGVEGQVHL